jgi:hypothetical protein
MFFAECRLLSSYDCLHLYLNAGILHGLHAYLCVASHQVTTRHIQDIHCKSVRTAAYTLSIGPAKRRSSSSIGVLSAGMSASSPLKSTQSLDSLTAPFESIKSTKQTSGTQPSHKRLLHDLVMSCPGQRACDEAQKIDLACLSSRPQPRRPTKKRKRNRCPVFLRIATNLYI